MKIPTNTFKQAILAGRPQIGLWAGLSNAYVTELLATTGFDWLCIDAEHAPNDPRSVLPQLQAMASYNTQAVVRPVSDDAELIKQYLDSGVQTLLIPMVETAAQAANAVSATRYPTRGIRGVGSALARASRWNQIDDYLLKADEEMCVIAQVESIRAMGNLADISQVEGIDGVFFGPADLSATMGLLGKPFDPKVTEAIEQGIATVIKLGKAAGTLTSDRKMAAHYLSLGALFVAVGVDTTLLVKSARDLVDAFKEFKDSASAARKSSSDSPY